MKSILLSAALLLSLPADHSYSAPAPFPKSERNHKLCRADFVGDWTMKWSGHEWQITLSSSGDYTCKSNSLHFVGSWGFDGKTFQITESCRPGDSQSWRFYSVELDRHTMSGRVSVGSPGTELRLIRPAR